MLRLSVDAPNPYFLVQNSIAQGRAYSIASGCATLMALAAPLWIAWRYRQSRFAPDKYERLLLLFTLSQLLVPFLLPRMHERYFFAGDVFAALLLSIRPRLLVVVAMLQTVALLTYQQYFNSFGYSLRRLDFLLPVLMMSASIGVLVVRYWKKTSVLFNYDAVLVRSVDCSASLWNATKVHLCLLLFCRKLLFG